MTQKTQIRSFYCFPFQCISMSIIIATALANWDQYVGCKAPLQNCGRKEEQAAGGKTISVTFSSLESQLWFTRPHGNHCRSYLFVASPSHIFHSVFSSTLTWLHTVDTVLNNHQSINQSINQSVNRSVSKSVWGYYILLFLRGWGRNFE